MDRQIQELSDAVARQGERIAQLERRLNRSSRNSSQPPSQDPPRVAPTSGKDSSGRRQGAQPGHQGKGRPLLPAWTLDEVVEHWPDRCECGHVFAEDDRVAVGGPVRHQVEELPAISAKVAEHRCQRVRCPGCGRRRRARLPREIAASAFGPRCQAAVALGAQPHQPPRRGRAVRAAVRFTDQHRHRRRDPRPHDFHVISSGRLAHRPDTTRSPARPEPHERPINPQRTPQTIEQPHSA